MLNVGDIIKLKNLDSQFNWWFKEMRNKIALIYKLNESFKDYYYVYVNNKIFLFYLVNDVNYEIVG